MKKYLATLALLVAAPTLKPQEMFFTCVVADTISCCTFDLSNGYATIGSCCTQYIMGCEDENGTSYQGVAGNGDCSCA